MQSCELVSLITAIACAISKSVSNDELLVLGAAFTQLGDTLTTIAVQNQLCDKGAD